MKLRISPKGRLYECFECGWEYETPCSLSKCLHCGEEENFYLMD